MPSQVALGTDILSVSELLLLEKTVARGIWKQSSWVHRVVGCPLRPGELQFPVETPIHFRSFPGIRLGMPAVKVLWEKTTTQHKGEEPLSRSSERSSPLGLSASVLGQPRARDLLRSARF